MQPGQPSATQRWSRALSNIAPLRHKPFRTLAGMLDDAARAHGDKPALVMAHESLTYRGLSHRKNQLANWAKCQNLAPGQVVCLLMRNRPDYVAVWLGLTQRGVVAALINTNLRGVSLAHAIQESHAVHVIADSQFLPSLAAALATLPAAPTCWCYGGADVPGAKPLDPAMLSTEPNDVDTAAAEPGHPALLIYTSGTTGLPKAARISHYRILEWSLWFAAMANVQPEDRLYDCLPLYHSTGGVALIGAMLVSGATVEVRPRFSASAFWQDVTASGCTMFVYIGELCRYLLHAPTGDAETRHGLRLCIGNGLDADVWRAFAARFRIPEILEFYASTEGNVSLYNCEGKPGAIGRVPGFLAKSFPVAIIECDTETGEPVRGSDGRCIRCSPGVPGEAIGRIATAHAADPSSFDGYTDAAATHRKILRNAFSDGDQWFRTGDLMMQDAERFFYFVDRMGDTFRWKGENVSSTEVAAALCRSSAVTFALVYGVKLAGADGKVGMAALTVQPSFCPRQLHADIAARLPHYARPMFLRICGSLDMTGTFKPIKRRLALEGLDARGFVDPIYIDDARAGTYRLLDREDAARLSGADPAHSSALQSVPVS